MQTDSCRFQVWKVKQSASCLPYKTKWKGWNHKWRYCTYTLAVCTVLHRTCMLYIDLIMDMAFHSFTHLFLLCFFLGNIKWFLWSETTCGSVCTCTLLHQKCLVLLCTHMHTHNSIQECVQMAARGKRVTPIEDRSPKSIQACTYSWTHGQRRKKPPLHCNKLFHFTDMMNR